MKTIDDNREKYQGALRLDPKPGFSSELDFRSTTEPYSPGAVGISVTVYTVAQLSVSTFDVNVGQNGVRMREISKLLSVATVTT